MGPRGVAKAKRAPVQQPARVRAPKRARAEAPPAEVPVDDDFVQDAEDMAEDVSGLDFLTRADLPDVSRAGAQGRERERIAELNRQQLRESERRVEDSGSESTDMEGASDSEGDDLGELDDEDLDDLDDEALDALIDDEGVDEDHEAHDEALPEDRYAAVAARRSRREEKAQEHEREALARRRLPIRSEAGEVLEQSDSEADEPEGPTSRAVYSDEDEDEDEAPAPSYMPSSGVHSARFGMQAPYDILTDAASNNARQQAAGLAAAREQIARLSSQIVGDPEMNNTMLERLLVFAQERVAPPPDSGQTKAVAVHAFVRQLAILSLLAVFVDIIPGYRIRALSEHEEREKVSQDVARRREWEQTLVRLYRDYLECCEIEVRRTSSPLAPVALRCFCTLLVRAPHFNYRKNLLASVIAHLSRRSWTSASEQCYTALVELLQLDNEGEIALECVQLLYRMIRERHFAVHANVLDVLTHLRLRDELSKAHRSGPMGSASAAAPAARAGPTPAQNRRADPRKVRKGLEVRQSKKQAKRNRELRAIESEMREAEAAVDVEERTRFQSETLKLVFALYFRILKTPDVPQQLLASALEGIVHFAEYVSADFFRDLVQVLRSLLAASMAQIDEAPPSDTTDLRAAPRHAGMRGALFCITSALELLSGQGGALEIDIGDFFAALYRLLLPLAMSTCLEEEGALPPPPGAPRQRARIAGLRRWSEAKLLFHALDIGLVRVPRQAVYMSIDRSAAILRRLLTAAMHWPTTSALQALQVAHAILARTAAVDSRFEALVDNRDSVRDGQHDAYADVPEGARVLPSGEPAWELCALSRVHTNAQVRETATALLNWTK